MKEKERKRKLTPDEISWWLKNLLIIKSQPYLVKKENEEDDV